MDNQTTLLKGELSSEQLSKELTTVSNHIEEEQKKVAKEILQRQEEEKIKATLTNPSAIALSTTKHDAGDGVNRVKKTPRQLFILYLTNQFVSRAVNIRADTLTSKGYAIKGDDEVGVKACEELIEESGGPNLFWQLGVNTYIAGDGFLEKIYNLNKTKILKLKHVHPLTLTFQKDIYDRIIVDSNTKDPVGYVQHYVEQNKKGDALEKTKNISKEFIAHNKFNTLGDEFTGISLIQSSYDTVVRLMNMEFSAAEASVKTANPLIVAKCNTKSPMQIAQWGTILGRINGRDQLFIPDGMEIKFLSPEKQNFSDYADYFLNAVVAGTGVPKAVLLGEGGGGNRAEGIVLTRHFYTSVRGDQKYAEGFFNEIFKEYGKLAGFKPPQLIFNDIAEDAHVTSDQAINLYSNGLVTREEARNMIGLEAMPTEGTLAKEIKESDMKTWHPGAPGSPEGSQKGEKKAMEQSPNSTFRKGKKSTPLK